MIATTIALVIVPCSIGAVAWFVWELHPWVPAGRAFALGKWRFADFEFQVWQRKNTSIFEPFADGLFVRQGTNQWRAFCLDIQDGYLPKVRVQQDGTHVTVYRDGEKRGVYEMTNQTFWGTDKPFTSAYIVGDPPGNWWLR